MGCISFLCKECGQGVNSDSFKGEMVKLFLLKDGKVLQEMEGEYDSYGRVFIDSKSPKRLRNSVRWEDPSPEAKRKRGSSLVELFLDDDDDNWGKVCDIIDKGRDHYKCRDFPDPPECPPSDSSEEVIAAHMKTLTEYWDKVPKELMERVPGAKGNGIAAIHSKCFKEIPTTCSEDDPDQGWNKIKARHRRIRVTG
jgi:hypothetical protein